MFKFENIEEEEEIFIFLEKRWLINQCICITIIYLKK